MKTAVRHRYSNSQRSFPGARIEVTKVDDISDDEVCLAQEKLVTLCEVYSFPAPKIQVIEALIHSKQKDRHFISTIQVNETKISSYPTLYTSSNAAKLDALTRAIQCISLLGEEVSGSLPAESDDHTSLKKTAGQVSEMPTNCTDIYQYEYAAEPDVYAVGDIYAAEPESHGVESKVYDIYSDNFNADEITEAELYGDAPADDSMVYENSYQTETGPSEVAEPVLYENQEASAEENIASYAPADSGFAAQNGEYDAADDPNAVYGNAYGAPDAIQTYEEAYGHLDPNAGYEQPCEVSDPNLIYGEVYEVPNPNEPYAQVDGVANGGDVQAYEVVDPNDPYGQMYEVPFQFESGENDVGTEPLPMGVEPSSEYGNIGNIYDPSAGDENDPQNCAEPYSEAQYAQYAQEALEQGLDPTADPAQYYAAQDASTGYETAYQGIDPATGLYYASEYVDSAQQCYYDGTGYAAGTDVETVEPMESYGAEAGTDGYQPELTYQESSETVLSAESAFYDESFGAQSTLNAPDQYASYGAEDTAAQSTEYGAGFTTDAAAYAEEEQMELVDGMASMTLQNGESETQYFPDAEGIKTEYAEYYDGSTGESLERSLTEVTDSSGLAAGGYLEQNFESEYVYAQADYPQALPEQVAAAELYQPYASDDIDIYAVDELPPFDTVAALSTDETQALPEADAAMYYGEPTAYVDFQQTQDGVDPSYQCSTVGEVDINQMDQEQAALYEAAGSADATGVVMQEDPNCAYAQMNQYEETAQSQTDVPYSEEQYQSSSAGEIAQSPATEDVPLEGDAVETTQKLLGSLDSRLPSGMIVNISFQGQVTLNLHSPAYDAFVELQYKHKPNPVAACEVGQWYIVHHDTEDDTTAKRAVAQYMLGDGESYMMHYPDEGYMQAVPTPFIFEVENIEDICRVPPQGLTCDVMSLTEKRVSPHTVEILLSQWLYKTVYIIPVDTSGPVPKVRLIDSAGELLEV